MCSRYFANSRSFLSFPASQKSNPSLDALSDHVPNNEPALSRLFPLSPHKPMTLPVTDSCLLPRSRPRHPALRSLSPPKLRLKNPPKQYRRRNLLERSCARTKNGFPSRKVKPLSEGTLATCLLSEFPTIVRPRSSVLRTTVSAS